MEIHTKRLLLQKYNASDFEAFCDIVCNDEVMLNISGKGNTRKVAKEKFDWVLKTNQENQYYGLYKVILLETNKVIGFAKITPFEEDCSEIGYALLPPFWRKGFTTEMIKKLTDHCIEYLSDKKIMAIVNIENVASLKALEKCNYTIYEEAEFKGASCYLLEFKIT